MHSKIIYSSAFALSMSAVYAVPQYSYSYPASSSVRPASSAAPAPASSVRASSSASRASSAAPVVPTTPVLGAGNVPVPAAAAAALPAAQVLAYSRERVSQARLIPTVAERIALLNNEEYEFDFLAANTGLAIGAAGFSATASSLNFPALVGTGMSMTVGFLGPCGLNTPHTHPRATEMNYVVNGSLRTGFLMENGARFVFNEAPAGSVSVFPAGAIHFEQNNGCEPVMFIAGFNHEDGGVTAVSQRFFGLPPDIVGASLGGLTPEEIAAIETRIPNNIALGADECLARCGITRPALQPTSQRQTRNPGNALPAAFNATNDPAALYPTPTTNTTGVRALSAGSVTGTDNVETNAAQVAPLSIALIAINGVFVLGALVAIVYYVRRRKTDDKRGKYVNPSDFKVSLVEHAEYYTPEYAARA